MSSRNKKKEVLSNHFQITFTAFGCNPSEIEKIKDTFIREWNKQQHILNDTLIIAVPET